MQQCKIHINFQALLLSIQAQERGKKEKEISFRKMEERWKISDVCAAIFVYVEGFLSQSVLFLVINEHRALWLFLTFLLRMRRPKYTKCPSVMMTKCHSN